MSSAPRLVLASTSPYRRQLLERLEVPFETAAPDTDETRRDGEMPEELVRRLAEEKARAVASAYRDALIIGSDQVAVLEGDILGKPGNYEENINQLISFSGRRLRFLTGLSLLNTATNFAHTEVVFFDVVFRSLGKAEIESYVRKEKPYDCAGGFRSEGLGISLFRKMQGDDPTALVGLPLIRLCDMLADQGFQVLDSTRTRA
jgi:septum formation protein